MTTKMYDDSAINRLNTEGAKLRLKILAAAWNAKGGHIGGAYSVLDLLIYMYEYVLKFEPLDPLMSDRDRLIFSKGHSCLALYACLEKYGCINDGELMTFLSTNSRLPGHSEHFHIPGIEITTGSLGHGIGVAAGIAMAERKKKSNFRTFCILGDGECNEGSVWESLMFIRQHNLNKLITIIDSNKLESLDFTENILSIEPLSEKIKAFGLNAIEINGHSFKEIANAFTEASKSEKPSVIIAHTVKGKGVDFMEGETKWHYRAPTNEEFESASKQLTSMQLMRSDK